MHHFFFFLGVVWMEEMPLLVLKKILAFRLRCCCCLFCCRCRRSLPAEVSEAIIRALVLRLFAYGFAATQQMVPHSLNKEALTPSKSPVSNRLISCTQESIYLFPRDAAVFMKTQLCLSKHWETPLDGGSHIDHPKAPYVACATLLCRFRAVEGGLMRSRRLI